MNIRSYRNMKFYMTHWNFMIQFHVEIESKTDRKGIMIFHKWTIECSFF